MKNFLLRISKWIDSLVDFCGQKVAWLTTVLMILICIDVVLRYFLSSSKTWIIELEWHLFSIIFLIGASYTFLHDKHVRVDLFYEKARPARKRLINALGILLFVIPWCLVVLNTSWDYAMNSFSFRETSPQPGGLPARYVIKFFIFLGFALLLLQAFSQLIKSIFSKSE